MVQETDQKLSLKVLDFGKANPLRGESYDLRGEQDDIYQVIRLFSAIYVGDEFESAKHMKDSYGQSELVSIVSGCLQYLTLVYKIHNSFRNHSNNAAETSHTCYRL